MVEDSTVPNPHPASCSQHVGGGKAAWRQQHTLHLPTPPEKSQPTLPTLQVAERAEPARMPGRRVLPPQWRLWQPPPSPVRSPVQPHPFPDPSWTRSSKRFEVCPKLEVRLPRPSHSLRCPPLQTLPWVQPHGLLVGVEGGQPSPSPATTHHSPLPLFTYVASKNGRFLRKALAWCPPLPDTQPEA